MNPWREVSPQEPCTICAHPDWCARSADGAWAICRRVDTGEGRRRVDKAGGEYWLYPLDGSCPAPRAPALPARPSPPCADPLTRDLVYRALLTTLPLIPPHRQNLKSRGLPEPEIGRRGYRTLVLAGRAALARRLVEQWGADVCARIPGLYVAEREDRRWWSLAGAPGLLIPVRDLEGRIVALKIRADAPGDGPRYTLLSSTRYGGPGPGAQVHVPLHIGAHDVVRVTEGELKADIATALSGMLTLSLPGVAHWAAVVPVLAGLHPRQVLLAFDADWRTNRQVALALGHIALALLRAGYALQTEDWAPAQGKGIDDLLAAGGLPARHAATLALGGLLRGWTQRTEEVSPWH